MRGAMKPAVRIPGWLAAMVAITLASSLVACGSGKPPTPAWQLAAAGGLERYTHAALSGDARVASAEFARARSALASTGDASLVARAELTRCALDVASLLFERCEAFEAIASDVAAPEQIYARYLQGVPLTPSDQARLPLAHQRVAGAATDAARALAGIEDPVARIVAAGVLLRAGRGSPEVMQVAVDTASAQGWRRPLAMWLRAQVHLAEQRGQAEEAQRLRRRLELVTGAAP
jgi:hypothetical protein